MAFADLVATVDRATRDHLGGVDVVYAPAVGDPVTVEGLFDENFVLIDDSEAGVEQTGPAVFLRLDELPTDPAVDDPILTIEGKVYKVRGRRRDSLRGIRLLLHLRS
jgi:hypothetical protein